MSLSSRIPIPLHEIRGIRKKARRRITSAETRTWLCEVDIDHGADLVQEIDQELKQTNLVLLIWSPEADASKWTHKERSYALKRHVEEPGRCLASVL